LPLDGIRLLGESSKNHDQIGMFGTGLKETIALCFRLGIGLTICSGESVVSFDTKTTRFRNQDTKEIVYNCGGSFPMNITTNFGKQDWNSEWQVLREIFSNAYDEGGLHHDIVDVVEPISGCTRVYLEGTFDLLDEYSRIEKKLLFLTKRNPLYECKYGKVYRKTSGVVYKKGVWVHEDPNLLFDYELTSVELNESRSIKQSSLWVHLAWTVSECPWEYQSQVIEASWEEPSPEMRHFLNYGCRIVGENWTKNNPTKVIAYPNSRSYKYAAANGVELVPVESESRLNAMEKLGFNILSFNGIELIKLLDNSSVPVPTYLGEVKDNLIEKERIVVRKGADLKMVSFEWWVRYRIWEVYNNVGDNFFEGMQDACNIDNR